MTRRDDDGTAGRDDEPRILKVALLPTSRREFLRRGLTAAAAGGLAAGLAAASCGGKSDYEIEVGPDGTCTCHFVCQCDTDHDGEGHRRVREQASGSCKCDSVCTCDAVCTCDVQCPAYGCLCNTVG